MLSQVLIDWINFLLILKEETTFISKHIIDSSLCQALKQLILLGTNSLPWFFQDFSNFYELLEHQILPHKY